MLLSLFLYKTGSLVVSHLRCQIYPVVFFNMDKQKHIIFKTLRQINIIRCSDNVDVILVPSLYTGRVSLCSHW